MKRQIKFILTLLALIAVLAGCGSKPQEAASNRGGTGGGSLTKGEWIGLLGDKFGYNDPFTEDAFYSDVNSGYAYYAQIQACAEWEVIPEQGTFQPEDAASWEYAIQTAVRAVGIDRITNAGLSVSEDTLVDFFRNNIANTGAVDLNDTIAAGDAEQLLGYAVNYMYGLAPAERFEYTYNENVHETSADAVSFRGDGMTATVNDGRSYQVGDIIYLAPSATETAAAIRVTGTDGGQLTYEQASVEDVYSELQISGAFDATIVSVESADMDTTEVSLRNTRPGVMYCAYERQSYTASTLFQRETAGEAVQTGASFNGNTAHFDVSLGGNGEFAIDITNIKVTTDIDYSFFGGLKHADAVVTFDDKITVSYTAEHYSKSIPLGSVQLQLGTTPCNVELSLTLNIGFDGEVTLTYTSSVVGSLGYKKNCGLSKSLDNQNATFDFHAEATVTAEPTAKVDLRLLNMSIANLQVTTGVVAVANVDVDLMGNQPTCVDIYLYVPLRWGINQDGCIMTNISDKLKYSQTIWDSENSPINKRFHWEDGVETPDDQCTRGQNDQVETGPVDEDGQPYDEFKLFEFEELDFGIIRVASIQLVLEQGESMNIGITSVPNGYQASELVYTVSDPSVCSVNGGTVTAAGVGSTTVKISTSDGKYNTYITVTVNGGYIDTSNFQPL